MEAFSKMTLLVLLSHLLISGCSNCSDPLLITDKGLGEISIGESLNQVRDQFPSAIESTDFSEGVKNKVLKTEDECGYIVFRFDGDYLAEIRTNSKRVYSNSSIKVGIPISTILTSGESIEAYEDYGGDLIINIIPSNVKFYLCREDALKYYSGGGDFDVNIDPDFRIEEFVVLPPRP